MRLLSPQLSNQVTAGDDVSPLIAAAKLQRAFEPIVKHEKVVRLQQRIAELCVGDAVLAFNPPPDRY